MYNSYDLKIPIKSNQCQKCLLSEVALDIENIIFTKVRWKKMG